MSSKIFVVEDDALVADQLQRYIEEMGCQFLGSAKSAEAALQKIRQEAPDLVLMDIRLKGEMDGIELAAKLKAEFDIAVIYLTAYAEDATLARARLTEPTAYLLKPFSKQELKAGIEMGLYKREMEGLRKSAEEKIRSQEEFFRLIAENVKDFIAVLDLDGKRLYSSPSYARLFGSTEDLKGTDSFAEIHPDDRERIKALFEETVQSGIGQRAEYRFVLGNGDIRHMESSGGLIRDGSGKASRVVVISHDITSRKQAEQEIHQLAFYDQLTQLPNRCMLGERFELMLAASKRSGKYGAVLFIDLNNFKPLNDLFGHTAGDLLLVDVAKRLKSCIRETDTVARFGGDEFVMILGELDTDKEKSRKEACVVAEKIRTLLAEPYVLKIRQQGKAKTSFEHHCTTSIGVALFIDHGASQDELIKWADSAMYQAKEAGRNQIRFYAANS